MFIVGGEGHKLLTILGTNSPDYNNSAVTGRSADEDSSATNKKQDDGT